MATTRRARALALPAPSPFTPTPPLSSLSVLLPAPGGKWSISNLEAMADEKQADWDTAVASNNVPWFLTAWFDATARGRAAGN